jgi:hypothetical protein
LCFFVSFQPIELCPERRKVIKDERSSLGARGTPACALNTALTSLVHCGAPSGFEASVPGTKTYGCAALLVPVRPVEPSHAVSSAAAGAGTVVMVGPNAALVLCAGRGG